MEPLSNGNADYSELSMLVGSPPSCLPPLDTLSNEAQCSPHLRKKHLPSLTSREKIYQSMEEVIL